MKAPFIAHSELTGRYYLVASLWPDGSARKKADITDLVEKLFQQRNEEQTQRVQTLEAENAALRDALKAWQAADVHICECEACGEGEECCDILADLWATAAEKTRALIGQEGQSGTYRVAVPAGEEVHT